MLDRLKRIAYVLWEPLTADPDMELRLSIPESQTTTIDGDIGWEKRPPSRLRCPDCDSEILHYRPRDAIDCPRCAAEFSPDRFPELELLYMTCPVCQNRLDHGRRHPRKIDVPEYATCHSCRYHWELEHF